MKERAKTKKELEREILDLKQKYAALQESCHKDIVERQQAQVIRTEQRNVLLFDENNEPYAIEGNAGNFTDRAYIELGRRKETERNSLLLGLFAKAPALTDKELYDQALDIAVGITDSKIGFFHQVSDDQQEIIITTWNDEAKKNCTTIPDNHYPIEKAGNWADCVRQKKALVYNDYTASPNKKGLPEGHSPVGRMLCIPVVSEDKVRLIFGVGNKSSDYTDTDLVQIQAIANEMYRILEKRKVEQTLRKIEDRWQFAIEGSNDGIWDWNMLTDEVFFSNRWKEMIGYGPDELGGKLSDWQTRVHPDDIQAVMPKLQQHLNQETPDYASEHRILCRDGSWKWILDRGRVLQWTSGGKPFRMVGTHTDITERRLAEEQLRESEVQYRNLANAGSALLWTSGTDRLCNYFNDSWLRFTGRTLEQEMGNGWAEGVHPDDFDRCINTYTSAFDKNVPFEMVYRLRHSSGEYRWLLDLGTPNFDSTGEFIGYIGHCFDITERKLIEDTQTFMLGCGLPGTGEDFFESLARYLAETLSMDYVCIDRLEGDGLMAQTVAIYNEGGFESNVLYALKDTPCGEVVDRSVCCYRRGVRQLFPNDAALQDLNAESYIGTTLLSSKGLAIGLIALIGHQALPDERKAETILKLVAPRAAGELERREAENALKETLEQLNQVNLHLEKRVEERTREILEISGLQNAILANAPLAIMTINEGGIYQSINPAGEDMLGYSADEIIGKLTPLSFHDREEMLKICAERTASVNPTDEEIYRAVLDYIYHRTTEWTWIRKSGERFNVRITHSSIVDDNGTLQGYMGLISDITQERHASESLRESEERFHSMFYDHAAVMLLNDSESGEIIEANRAAEQFYGLPINSKPKLSIATINVLSPDAIKQEMEDALSQQRNYFIFPHRLASGEIRTVEVHSTPIEVRGEKVLFSIIHDITERKLAEDALKKSEAENRAIIQAVPDLMFRIHRDGTYLDSHSQNESALYVPKEYFVGKKLSEVLPPDLAAQSMQAIESALATGEVEQYEYLLAIEEKDRYFENRMIAISENEVLSIIRDISQRKESEAALKMQSAAFEALALSIIITDIKGRIQWVNSAFTQLTGFSVDEAIGRTPGDLVKSGMQDDGFYETFWATILGKNVWSGELINRRKDGSLYYEEETIAPVLDAQGNISSFIAIKIDITERKMLYQELADERRRLVDIIKGTNAGTWEWNVQTGETVFNEQWAQMLGYTLDEISPVSIETWMRLAHPDDLKRSGELLEMHFKGELDDYSFESRMKHKSGEWMWVLDSGRVHQWDSDGKPLLMSGTHQDISQRKRADEELQWNKSFLELMSNSSPLGFLVIDNRSDDILYFNRRFCQIWEIEQIEEQLTRGELKNNDIIPYCLPVLADIPAFADSCKPLQDEANRVIVEDEIAFTGNRTIRRFSTQIRGENDEYFGRFYIFEDITKRKRTEADLRRARSEAEKANLAKSEFLSRMSHELRTPMNSILGFAQLMEMGELQPKHKKGVTHILNNGKHLLSLINEVLDISGIEAGRQILAPEPVQLAAIILETCDSIHVAANKGKVSIMLVDSPANSLFVLADRLRLKQVLINLCSNAIKYNSEGGLVTIKTALQPANEQACPQVRISISDTGKGILPEDMGKLFQAFERIGADRTETEGTGLGLMVVKKLAEVMGGSVGVDSVVGTGSTFWIELPLTEDRKAVTSQITGPSAPEMPATQQGATILYIEDNLSNLELVEDILAEHRPEIRLISSIHGKQALKLALEHAPGLILLDLNLPDVHGMEVLEQLSSDAHTSAIPVIIISSDAMPFQAERLLKAGAIDYLAKPLDVVDFLQTIDRRTII
jgi:PAS domain S-box-containing protein